MDIPAVGYSARYGMDRGSGRSKKYARGFLCGGD
jgi:hypothetical protein